MGVRALTGLLLFLAVATTSSAGEVVVTIKGLRFEPRTVTVKAGTTVRWVNLDETVHDVTSGKALTGREARGRKRVRFPDGRFSSGTFGKGEAFTFTFEEEGVYPYFCNVHPFMKGVVVVTPP